MIQQGTEEWLKLRKGKITASKIAIIMGLSPYQTPRQLWEEELGFRAPQESTPHMQAGLDAEKEMADYFYEQTGIEVVPEVVFHKDYPQFMASLDGINLLRSVITEFKNNNKSYHEMARIDQIVRFHQAQMQWQMFCEGEHIREARYISRNSGEKIIIPVYRDDSFIEEAKAAAFEFLRKIEDLEEPELTDRDYVDARDDVFLADKARLYKYYTAMSREFASKSEAIKEEIHSYANGKNILGNGIKITRYKIPGRLDYDAIMKHHNIDVEKCQQFRKPEITSYRITT